MKKDIGKYVLGGLLIALGVIVLGRVLDFWKFEIFFDGWWTLFIIIPCIASIGSNGFKTHNVGGLVVGVLLLLGAQNVIDFTLVWKIAVPAILIIWGLSIVFGKKMPKEFQQSFDSYDGEKYTYEAIFSGQKPKAPQDFRNGEITAVFGGVEIDLSNLAPTEDIYITATAVFGGVDIYLPRNVKLVLVTTGIFGGTDDKTNLQNNDSLIKCYVKTYAVFGGVEIK